VGSAVIRLLRGWSPFLGVLGVLCGGSPVRVFRGRWACDRKVLIAKDLWGRATEAGLQRPGPSWGDANFFRSFFDFVLDAPVNYGIILVRLPLVGLSIEIRQEEVTLVVFTWRSIRRQ
jgi:hypothetical protein